MEKWRELAIQLFPDQGELYENTEERLADVLFDLHDEIIDAHRRNDVGLLRRIYTFTGWCHAQKGVDLEIWTEASTIFYEHLVEDKETYHAIPNWVEPDVFQDMLWEYQDRLENKLMYPGESPGTFHDLLALYDSANGTGFAKASGHESK